MSSDAAAGERDAAVWGGVFLVAALSVGLGRAGAVPIAGRDVVVTWMDLASVAVFLAGAWSIRRTRGSWRPDDRAAWWYAGLVVFVAVQVAVPFVGETFDLEIATGASRFVAPGLLLLGLTWLRGSLGGGRWPWREGVTALGLLIALGIARDVLVAAGSDIGGYYDWKRAIQQELGVSNILAAYTAVALWCSASLAIEDRRWIPAPILLGLATAVTLSRAALLGMLVGAVVIVVGRRFGGRAAAAGLLTVTLGLTIVPISMDTGPSDDGLLASELRVRDEQFTAAWEAWQDQPVLGVGLNRFEEDVTVRTAGHSAAAVDGVIPYEHPNNAWLVALAELGLVGTVLYLGLWVLLVGRIIALPDSWPKFAAAGAVSGLAVHAQLEALTFTRGIEIVLALLLVALAPLPHVAPQTAE